MQIKESMDAHCMDVWVDEVLAPYIATTPAHVKPIIILDSYCCHMMLIVVSRIKDLGVEVQHIPGRFTSHCQPVDVGFNMPFKGRLCHLWADFLVTNGLVDGKIPSLERIQVATWMKNSSDMLVGHDSLMIG